MSTPPVQTAAGAAPDTRAAKATSTVPGNMARLASLDAFRGFTMFWITAGAALVSALQQPSANPLLRGMAYQLSHTPWQGLRYYDCIWPSFMLMVGVSVAFSLAKRSQTQSRGQILLQGLKRAIVLFLLGSLRESISLHQPYLIELSSALQPIAVAYLVAVFLENRSWKLQTTVAALLLAGYGLLLALVSAPGVPAGSYEIHNNLVLWCDLKMLGRAHPKGWGTVICTIPTISTTLLGLLIGKLLLSRSTPQAKAAIIALTGCAALLAGYALGPVVPIIMKLWTASYGLASAGWACLLFSAFYWVVDVRGYRVWAFPLSVVGMNAVAAYIGNSLVPVDRLVGIFTGGGPGYIHAATFLVVEWSVLYWMYKRGIFIKA